MNLAKVVFLKETWNRVIFYTHSCIVRIKTYRQQMNSYFITNDRNIAKRHVTGGQQTSDAVYSALYCYSISEHLIRLPNRDKALPQVPLQSLP